MVKKFKKGEKVFLMMNYHTLIPEVSERGV